MSSSSIWDLRCGDADDNRTSPYGRGMRSVVLSALVDFNIPKASVAFLTLVIGPALLIGIAPSVALTYGRMKVHAVGSVNYSPVVALLMVAVLAGGAMWIGRPLLRVAIENFWHLHYTLVFPAFVALREVIRMATERLPRPPITTQELHHKRRAGTILAALLLAALGIGVALMVEVSVGIQIVDVRQVRTWAAVRAALSNVAVILGVSAAVESIYWLWRELALRSPVLNWSPVPAQAPSRRARVGHLSDPHLVGERYGYRMESGTRGPRGNGCMLSALRKLREIHASAPFDRIFVTGDVTDAGTRAEWAEFLDLIREFPDMRERLAFVPGNHDINVVDRARPGLFDLPWSTSQSLRKLRVVLALDTVQGERFRVVNRESGALGPTLHEYLREGDRAALLGELAERGSRRAKREMARVWNGIFPLVEPAGDHGYGVILLNSNARSHFSLTNAIGVVDRAQLRALKSILRNSAGSSWVILLHHQVVEYPITSIPLRDRIGLALINAPDVLAAINPYASRALILHGHRHRDWIGMCGNVVLCSAPSVTLGSYGSEMYRGGFHIHEFAIGVNGCIALTGTERVSVV